MTRAVQGYRVSHQLIKLVGGPACSLTPPAHVQDRKSLMKNNLCVLQPLPPPWKGKTMRSRGVRARCIGGSLLTAPGHVSPCPEPGGQAQPRTWQATFYGTRFCDPSTPVVTFFPTTRTTLADSMISLFCC